MSKCFYCGKKIKGEGVLISADGDFVCDKKCEKEYEIERDYFLNVIIKDDSLLDDWWGF